MIRNKKKISFDKGKYKLLKIFPSLHLNRDFFNVR